MVPAEESRERPESFFADFVLAFSGRPNFSVGIFSRFLASRWAITSSFVDLSWGYPEKTRVNLGP